MNNILQQAGLYIDSNGVLIYAEDNENNWGAKLTVQANRITQEVTDRSNADQVLDGKITVEAGRITQIVSAVGANGEVTAASIVLAINGSSSSVSISGDKVDINGSSVVINAARLDIAGIIGSFVGESIKCGTMTAGWGIFESLRADNYLSVEGNRATWKSQTVVYSASVTFPGITRSAEVTVGTTTGRLITAYTSGSSSFLTTTINYLGR